MTIFSAVYGLSAPVSNAMRKPTTLPNNSPRAPPLQPISFIAASEKENWRHIPDMRQFRCFSDLWTERFQWQTSRLGVFCTETRNWVAATNWENIPFHVWAAFIDNYTYCGEKRVRLVIYDCNSPVDYSTSGSEIHLRDLQNGGQKAFIR